MNILSKIAIKLIDLYQIYLSPDHSPYWSKIRRPACRYYPTCSEYARQELQKGPLFGACWHIIVRLASCHPCGRFSRSRRRTHACTHQVPPESTENAKRVHQPPLFDATVKNNRAPTQYDF